MQLADVLQKNSSDIKSIEALLGISETNNQKQFASGGLLDILYKAVYPGWDLTQEDTPPATAVNLLGYYGGIASDIMNEMNKTDGVTDVFASLMKDDKSFQLAYDPKKFDYFSDNNKAIKGQTVIIKYTNKYTHVTRTYTFIYDRAKHDQPFTFESITVQ